MKKVIITGFIGLFLLFFLLNVSFDISVNELKAKYTNSESEFLELYGMQVHYRDEGQGQPIVLIHGTGASLLTWDAWTEELKKNYRVIRMDIPAFGLTGPHPEHDYQIETYARFINDFLEKLDLDSVYFGGNSLGGNIAWYTAAEYPDKVSKLILVDASGFPSASGLPMVFKLARTPVVSSLLRYITPISFIRKNLEEVYYDDPKVSDMLVAQYYEMALREGNREAFIQRARTDHKDNTNRLADINIPTLILWGKQDIWIPVENGEKFQSAIKDSKLVVLDSAGHVPMEEVPQRSLKPVLDFLE